MQRLRVVALTIMSTLAIISCTVNVNASSDILNKDEFELLTKCVHAEAGNQGYYGKRLVACVILNRIDNEDFPDTLTDVVMQDGQFSVVSNGIIKTVDVDEETIMACNAELRFRCREDILYFNNSSDVSGEYCYKYKDHWFGR